MLIPINGPVQKITFGISCTMPRKLFFLLIIICSMLNMNRLTAQDKNPVSATRITTAPKIDGQLNDYCWSLGTPYSDFIESSPTFGLTARHRTEVTIVYDNDAIYLGAKCFMPTDSIWMQLTKRDDVLETTDVFAIGLDTYHDGQNALAFGVSPRNVQVDFKLFLNTESDFSWDAVWDSKVYLAEDGWYVEMKIPYSALRFPKIETQEWYIDFYRVVRSSRFVYHSASVDPEANGLVSQFQPLIGVTDIQPPLRLSLSPYATGYANFYSDKQNDISESNLDFKGGMDLKWGITESFTLDATLIPDFGQVQSDNIIYNLTAFEVQYDENRSFFTEGTELFTKAELFYSRRIGFVSDYFEEHGDNTLMLVNPPINSQLLNATKFSGRNRNGLGIGVFNAVTGNTYATAIDEEGNTKEVLVDPLTNSNVLVFDQALKNNSYVTFTNTNVIRDQKGRDANVANIMSYIANKKQTYAGFGYVAVSTLMNETDSSNNIDFTNGFLYQLEFQKISGNFKFNFSHLAISEDYNINDLGFLNVSNYNEDEAYIFYDIYEPFGKFLEFHSQTNIDYNYRNNDGAYIGLSLNGNAYIVNRNYLGYFTYYYAAPFGLHDYYEPRVENRYYAEPAVYEIGAGFSTDYRKHFALDLEGGPAIWSEPGRIKYRWQIKPRIRIGDRIFMIPLNETHLYYNNVGYVAIDSLSNIIFGRRDVSEFDNSITGTYIFNSNMSMGFKLRYYTQKGTYSEFYKLEEDGSLSATEYNTNSNFNFNAWNIDFNFSWWFLPGSEINIVWKNSIVGFDDQSQLNFTENFEHTFDFPQNNNFSIRIRYYLDYQDVKRWVK
jgi:hypothetical protein